MKLVRIVTEVILVLLEITGATGGILMIVESLHGSTPPMPLSLLQHSPFHSYLVPGVILLCGNGFLPAFVLTQVMKCKPMHGLWVGAQGCVLLGWIVAQCVLLRMVNGLQVSYGIIAIVLILCGVALREARSSALAT